MYRNFRAALVVAMLCGLILAGVGVLKPRLVFLQRQHLAHALVKHLESNDENPAAASLEELAKLGTASIEVLVEAAASHRADLSIGARRKLEEKLAVWQNLAATDSQFDLATRLGELSHALAQHIDELGPVGRHWARSLVLIMVDLTQDLPPATAAPLLADCSEVMEGIPVVGSRKRTPNRTIEIVRPEPVVPEVPLDYQSFAMPSESILRQESELPEIDSASSSLPAPLSEANSKELAQHSLKPDSKWTPNWTRSNESLAQQKPSLSHELAGEHSPNQLDSEVTPPSEDQKFIDVPSPQKMEACILELQKLSTWNLFEEYRKAKSFEKSMLTSVLEQRNFEPVEFELGVRLVSPDRQERLTLVKDLQDVPARIARKWLRELLQDPDSEVRFQALSAMATTSDPQLIAWARELAAKDTDARVAALAARLVSDTR